MPEITKKQKPVILSIAGFDPSGGAGTAADLKTIAACGGYGVAALSAITVQDSRQVYEVVPLPAALFEKQIHHLLDDIAPRATKIGMLATQDLVEVLVHLLQTRRLPNIVLDPVLRSSSGFDLLAPAALERFKKELLPLADCVTPNLPEAAMLAGMAVDSVDLMKQSAQRIFSLGCRAVIVTGGHLTRATDVLYDGDSFEEFSNPLIDTKNTHGTGCTFSSALATYLALEYPLRKAADAAKQFVTQAIAHSLDIGKGRGPLDHFFRRQ